ncbi:MAG: porin family protein [Marinobacter sp.]|nr:porin family protein [Marinobacter sp.]
MNRSLLLATVASGLVFSSPQTLAQSPSTPEVRPYIGGGVGYYRLNDEDFLDEDDRLKDNRSGWRVFAGFDVNKVFALQADYIDFGKTSDGNARMEADGWAISGIAALPLSEHFAPYAKVGQLFWDRKRVLGPLSINDSDNDMFYGAGVRLGLSEHTDVRIEYERFGIDDTDLDMGSVSLLFRF